MRRLLARFNLRPIRSDLLITIGLFLLPLAFFWQVTLGNPLKALLCVGVAYFLIGVLVPLAALSSQGGVGGFSTGGSIWAGLGGALGALGAVCIIWAFKTGGLPNYVMPLVFGGAPVINVIVSMATHPPKTAPNPLLYVGFALAVLGAGMVLYYKPS